MTATLSQLNRNLRSAAVLMILACALGRAQAGTATFQEAFTAYAAGGNDQAAALWAELATHHPSVGVFHNLGNSQWKRGETGEAILAWERAQWLDPGSANTRANLRYARHTAQLPSPQLAWFEVCSTWLPVNAWAWLAMLSFWLAATLVLLPGILHWRKADWHQAVAAAGFAVFLLTLPALLGVQTRSKLGIIRAKDTPLRLTATREAQTLGKLPAGEAVRLERERGGYVFVRAGSDAAGWIEQSQFGRISGW